MIFEASNSLEIRARFLVSGLSPYGFRLSLLDILIGLCSSPFQPLLDLPQCDATYWPELHIRVVHSEPSWYGLGLGLLVMSLIMVHNMSINSLMKGRAERKGVLQVASQPCLLRFSSLGRLGCRVPRMTPNVELLQNSSGNSRPDLSFDKSASLECLFSLARVSLAEASKPDLSFRCFRGDYTSSCPPSLRHSDAAIDDPRPAAGSFNMADVRRLSAHVIKLRDMPEGTGAEVQDEPHLDVRPTLQRIPFYYTPPATAEAVILNPIPEDLAVGTPSSKIVAKAEASQKQKAASSHVAKHTRSALTQSSGSTTWPNLFIGDSDDKSDGDDDACVEIPLVTPLRSADVIPPSKNQDSQVIMSSTTSLSLHVVNTNSEPDRAFWGADDEEDEDDEDEEEEEEHLAPTDSTIDAPVDEHVFPPEGTKLVIPPPSTDITIGARITDRPQTSISLPPEAVVERLLTMTTPSPSPPILLSPPSIRERLARCMAPHAHSPPLPPPSGCPTQIQTLRITSTQALIDAVTAALPSPSLPPLPPSLSIPPPVDRRDDIPESEQPPRKRLYLSTIGSRYEIGESSTARPTRGRGIDYGFVSTVDAEERRQGIRDVGYGIRDTWVDPAEAVPEIAPMTVGEVNTRVIELAELHERDTQDLYALLEDAQGSRTRISQRVDMDSQRVDLLMGDRMTLQETVHETRFQMQQAELAALRETDRRRQDQMVETLRVIKDMRREMSDMQTELLALREQQRRARQPGPEARILDHQELL
ncbi:hypothetical protein Tco_0285114 [Tanacetum coccineum]